jgi:hypothetical protein
MGAGSGGEGRPMVLGSYDNSQGQQQEHLKGATPHSALTHSPCGSGLLASAPG